MVISEGVPHEDISPDIWRLCEFVVLWHLSQRRYDATTVIETPFHAVATNSEHVWKSLSEQRKRGAYIELAAPSIFARAEPREEYRAISTFLGVYPHKSEQQLRLVLLPASEVELAIWGFGWQSSQYAAYHRGVLPFYDIGCLYRSVNVVLALTEERQKRCGMINNRVFEALAAGATVISDEHPALRKHEIGEFVSFVSTEMDVKYTIKAASIDGNFKELGLCGQRAVLARHTYADRARRFLALYYDR
jgi:hypothetical protein